MARPDQMVLMGQRGMQDKRDPLGLVELKEVEDERDSMVKMEQTALMEDKVSLRGSFVNFLVVLGHL